MKQNDIWIGEHGFMSLKLQKVGHIVDIHPQYTNCQRFIIYCWQKAAEELTPAMEHEAGTGKALPHFELQVSIFWIKIQ